MGKERSWREKATEVAEKLAVPTLIVGAGFWIIGKKDVGFILMGSAVVMWAGSRLYTQTSH